MKTGIFKTEVFKTGVFKTGFAENLVQCLDEVLPKKSFVDCASYKCFRVRIVVCPPGVLIHLFVLQLALSMGAHTPLELCTRTPAYLRARIVHLS